MSILRTLIVLDVKGFSKARIAINLNTENRAAVIIQSMVRGVFGRAEFFKIPHVRVFYENLLVRTRSCTEGEGKVDEILDATISKCAVEADSKSTDVSLQKMKISHRESSGRGRGRGRVEEKGGDHNDKMEEEVKEEVRGKSNDSSAVRKRTNSEEMHYDNNSDKKNDDGCVERNRQVSEGCGLETDDALDKKKLQHNQDHHFNNFLKRRRTLFEFEDKKFDHPGYFPLGDSLLLLNSYVTDDSQPSIFLKWYMEITFNSHPDSSRSGQKVLLQVINSTDIKELNRDNQRWNVLDNAKIDNMTIRSTVSYPFSMVKISEILLTSQIRNFHLCSDITVSVYLVPDCGNPDKIEKNVNVKNIPQNNLLDTQSLHFEKNEINTSATTTTTAATVIKNLSISPNGISDTDSDFDSDFNFNENSNDNNSNFSFNKDVRSCYFNPSSSTENSDIDKIREILEPSFQGKISFQLGGMEAFGGRVFIVLHPNIPQLRRLHQSIGITSVHQYVRPLHVMCTIINMAMPSNQYLRLARTSESYNMISGEFLEPKQVRDKFKGIKYDIL